MAEIKDKVVTVGSLSTLHEHNKETYMAKADPVGTGSFSMNRKEGSLIGNNSTATGQNTVASGDYSHAEGCYSVASGFASHAEGYCIEPPSPTRATGFASHAEGIGAEANGKASHAEGFGADANGDYSHAEGYYSVANGESQHVQGKFNIEDTENKYAHIVGNGNDNSSRSNAHTIDWSGNAWFAGNVESSYIILRSTTPDSTKKFMISVNDSGNITAIELT